MAMALLLFGLVAALFLRSQATSTDTCTVPGSCPSRTNGNLMMQMQTKPGKAAVQSEGLGSQSQVPTCPATLEGVSFGKVSTSQIDECSGLAASRVNAGLYWVNNDSGAGPVLYGITKTGQHMARLQIQDAGSNDWEDIAVGPGPEPGKSYIYIADIGDNNRYRGTVQLYRVEEPVVPNGRDRNADIWIKPERFDVTWPQGKKYDCEAMFVDQGKGAEQAGTVGRVYVITKGDNRNGDPQWRGGDVFYADLPRWGQRLDFVATGVRLDVVLATGADIAPSGNLIAVRTYGEIRMWPRPCEWSVHEALRKSPCGVQSKNERQGEAIAFGKDGENYLTVSEGRYPEVWYFGMTQRFKAEMMHKAEALMQKNTTISH